MFMDGWIEYGYFIVLSEYPLRFFSLFTESVYSLLRIGNFVEWGREMKVLICILFMLVVVACSKTKESIAAAFAQQIIRESLKSPSTAQFIDSKIVYHKETQTTDFYIVKSEVDAQNSFGATIRGSYCAAFFHLKNEDEDYFRYHRESAIQTCDDRDGRFPIDSAIEIMKTMNSFP